jgi:regulator of cell morphogenesis and NO signaling
MLMEHDAATADLQQLRALSDGYRIPADACGSYRALYEGLAAMDADTETHMRKEGETLFPRATELAQAVAAGQ